MSNLESGKGGVLYAVTYGVTTRHLFESAGVFKLLREAKEAYEAISLGQGWQAKRLVRLSFKVKWEGCDKCEILQEVIH